MCCCGGALRPNPSPRLCVSPSLPLYLSRSPRESISQENCPPLPRPPSTKHVHTFSQSYPLTQCRHELLPVTPWFLVRGDRGLPDISSQNFRQNSSSLGDLAAKGAQARWRPSVPFVPRQRQRPPATHRGVRRARGSDPGLALGSASRTCSAMSMAAVAFEVFYLLDGTKTDDAGR